MDPIAHTLTGAALAATGMRRATPLATAALLVGTNLPDIDALTMFAGDYLALAHRRGWSHGVLAWAVLPLVLTGGLLLWDRLVRRRRDTAIDPARAGPLLLLSTLAVFTHPALDWLNNYGIRLLMPFDGRWFYGDALFIIDPWLWLILGGLAFLIWSRCWQSLFAWGLFWSATTWLVITNPLSPVWTGYLWCLGLVFILAVRAWRASGAGEKTARLVVVIAVAYMSANAVASSLAENRVRQQMIALGNADVEEVMVGPVAANPFSGSVVVATGKSYLLGHWRWLPSPALDLAAAGVPRNMDDPAVIAAAGQLPARRYLSWSRFPYAQVEHRDGGYRVRFLDARYSAFGGGLSGPVVLLDGDLAIVNP